MTEHQKQLLLMILDLQERPRLSTTPSVGRVVGAARVAEGRVKAEQWFVREHGPRIADLHGDGYDSAAVKRVHRALRELEAEGMVKLCGWGERVTHCKLTPAGVAVAHQRKGRK